MSTIALKYGEGKFPLDLVEKITAVNSKTFGYSVFSQDELTFSGVSGTPDAASLLETQNQVSEQTLYIFGDATPKLDEDLQPWEMVRDSKNAVVCVGYFEGNFDGFAKADSSHVPAYHAYEKLSRKLKMILRAVKDNATEVYEYCKTDDFQEEIKEFFTGEGSIVLHFNNDKILWFSSPPERKKTNEIGMFSDLCGWEPKEAPKVEPEPKGNPAMANLMASFGKKGSVPAAGEKRTSEPPKGTGSIQEVPNTMPAGAPTTYQGILATKTLRTISEEKMAGMLKAGGRFRHLENWYHDVGGGWPAGHDKDSIMAIWNEIKAGEKSGTWRESLKKLPGILSKKDKEDSKKEYEAIVAKGWATDNVQEVRQVVEASKDSVNKKVKTQEATDFLPNITERGMADLSKFKEKFFDRNGQPINRDPAKMKTFEDKWPSFLEKAGITSWDQLFGVPLEGWQMICNRHENSRWAMACMIAEIERLGRLVPKSQQAPPTATGMASLAGFAKRA